MGTSQRKLLKRSDNQRSNSREYGKGKFLGEVYAAKRELGEINNHLYKFHSRGNWRIRLCPHCRLYGFKWPLLSKYHVRSHLLEHKIMKALGREQNYVDGLKKVTIDRNEKGLKKRWGPETKFKRDAQ